MSVDRIIGRILESRDSRYRVTHIISQRAKALQEGCEPLVAPAGMKPVSLALMEYFEDKLEWIIADDEMLRAARKRPQFAEDDMNLSLSPEDLLSAETLRRMEVASERERDAFDDIDPEAGRPGLDE